ncbi:hypothetical protein SALBM311S_06191 [Streptomyces alboniger]
MTRRAVVIGAGLAGMLAAAALSGTADEVIVLDRDDLPDEPDHRKGLPQGRHAHLLMAGGLAAMEDLVPGISMRRHLLEAGAHDIPLGSGLVALTPEGWMRRWRHDGPHMLACSRALLDWAVRTAVLEHTEVEVRRAQVLELTGRDGRVTGVRLSTPQGETELDAAFVVDASGRGSRVTHWLEDLGVTDVPERTVDSGLVNATRVYRVPEGAERFPLTHRAGRPVREPAGAQRDGAAHRGRPVDGEPGRHPRRRTPGRPGGVPPVHPRSAAPHRRAAHLGCGAADRRAHQPAARPMSGAIWRRCRGGRRGSWCSGTRWRRSIRRTGRGWRWPRSGRGSWGTRCGGPGWGPPGWRGGCSGGRRGRWTRPGRWPWGRTVWYPQTRGARPNAGDRLVTRYSRRLTRAATGSYRAAAALWDVSSLTAGPGRLLQPATVLAVLNGSLLPPLREPPLSAGEREVLRGLERVSV